MAKKKAGRPKKTAATPTKRNYRRRRRSGLSGLLGALKSSATDFKTTAIDVVAGAAGMFAAESCMIPVDDICEIFDIEADAQRKMLEQNPLYRTSVEQFYTSSGNNEKRYFLPLEHCLTWMLGINAAEVKEDMREELLKYQHNCVKVLNNHIQNYEL